VLFIAAWQRKVNDLVQEFQAMIEAQKAATQSVTIDLINLFYSDA
jgi:hypothetical protein